MPVENPDAGYLKTILGRKQFSGLFSKTINSGKNARVLVWTTTSQRKSASNPKAIQQTHQADLSCGDTHSPFAGGGGGDDDNGDGDEDDAINNTDSGDSDSDVTDDDNDMMVTVMTKMIMIMKMLLRMLTVMIVEMMAKMIIVTIVMMVMMMTIKFFWGGASTYARN